MKRLINKIQAWWWVNFGYDIYMRKEKKRIKKGSVRNVYTDPD
jgi:hypothetical protein